MLCGLEREAPYEVLDAVTATVMEWAQQKWPALRASASVARPQGLWQANGALVRAHWRDDRGVLQWAFSSEHPDASTDRGWLTRVLVRRKDDILSVRVCNAFKGAPVAQATQPRFVRLLTEGLRARDAGIEVLPRPLFAQRAATAQDFYDHLLNNERKLPLVVLAPEGVVGEEGKHRYGANPFFLSQWLCALGHVVCVGAEANQGLQELIGPWCTVPAGGARVFMPGFDYGSAAADHPALLAAQEAGAALGTRLCGAVYALSVQTSAVDDFEDRWGRTMAP